MAKVYIERYHDGGWFVREEGTHGIGFPKEYRSTKWGAIRAAKRYIKRQNRTPKRIDIGETNA